MLVTCGTEACSTLVFGGGACVDCEGARSRGSAGGGRDGEGERQTAREQELRDAILRNVGQRLDPAASRLGRAGGSAPVAAGRAGR